VSQGSVPRPIARIGVTFAAMAVALFLVKSVVSTALFVLVSNCYICGLILLLLMINVLCLILTDK
jgi:hypothetical protein